MVPARHQNPAIRVPLERFEKAGAIGGSTAPDRARAVKDLMAAMRSACQSDIEQARVRLRYDFFRKALGEEQRVREHFYKVFDELMRQPAR